ncbi:hypothetical protein WA026_002110 [Henosepilachna vigintioctopunctata]|uniref:Ubiquinone biosynthesis protein n=1 Tax=Henosepilachna vigintioctopunctata TaxID=420089 RepID=A0AAW1U0V5_9CUCU
MSSLPLFKSILVRNARHSSIIFCKVRSFSNETIENQHDKEHNSSEIKHKILIESLKYVPEKGWSKEAITAGAEAIGYPGIIHGLFPSGGADLINFFQTDSNLKLVEKMKEFQKEAEASPVAPVDFVERAIQEKLLMIVPYKKRWPQAIAIMSLPPNVPTALASLLTLVDDICYFAGDRSVDFNWYARPIGIAGIYKASELYLIQDSSQDQKRTFEFLHRRLLEAVKIHDIICKGDSTNPDTKESIVSAFVTARNILGLNWNR